jgi:hypothetical protein
MAKQRLLEVNLFDKLFKTFLKAKAEEKESEWLQTLRKKDPELADIWHDWDDKLSVLMRTNASVLKQRGLEDSDAAKDVEDMIKRYGIK